MTFRILLLTNITLMLWQCAVHDNPIEKEVSETEYVVEDLDLSTMEEDSTLMEEEAEIECTFETLDVWPDFPFQDSLEQVVIVQYSAVRRGKPAGEMELDVSLLTDRFVKLVELGEEEIQQIKEIFNGYLDGEYSSARCYEPRHCIYFLGKNDKILGFFEVCFACRTYLTSHKEYFKFKCNRQLNVLKFLFQGLGFTKLNEAH
jgi:hypothetical protein